MQAKLDSIISTISEPKSVAIVEHLSLYPIPTQSNLNLLFHDLSVSGVVVIEVADIMGVVRKTVTVMIDEGTVYDMYLGDFVNGSYTIKVMGVINEIKHINILK